MSYILSIYSKKTASVFLFMTVFYNAFSQKTLELLSISQHHGFAQPYDSVYTNPATEKITKVEITIPVPLPNANVWYTSVYYEKINVSSNNTMPKDVANPMNLHAISFRTGLVRSIKNDQAIYVFLSPRMQGDYRKINLKTFHAGGLFFYEKKYRADFVMRYGFAYYHDYIGPFFSPLIYIYRQFTPKLKIVGTLPQDLRVHYKINEGWAFGFQQFAASNIFHMTNNNYMDDYILRKSITLSLYGRRQIRGPIFVEIGAGYAYGREYTQYLGIDKMRMRFPAYELGAENLSPKNVRFNDGLFLNARLVIDFSIENR